VYTRVTPRGGKSLKNSSTTPLILSFVTKAENPAAMYRFNSEGSTPKKDNITGPKLVDLNTQPIIIPIDPAKKLALMKYFFFISKAKSFFLIKKKK
jgi:hypothetical protein